VHPLVRQFEEKQKSVLQDKICKTIFNVGDKIKVKMLVIEIEKGKERKWTQTSEGVCTAKSNKGIASSFLIKRSDKDSTIFMRFPIWNENMQVEVVKPGRVRRAKLYYIHYRSKKKSAIKAPLFNTVKYEESLK